MTHFQNIENLLQQAVGFDRMFDRINSVHVQNQGYPPYNILKTDDEKYQVEIAVAGFVKDDIEIEVREGQLIVKGKKEAQENTQYVHKGIGTRAFTRTFTISDDVVVKGADMQNGILFIFLEHIVPEEKKPRKIEIGYDAPEQEFLAEG